ncbi:uncharacterized protein LOC104583378 isoform X2 [Brachypodium distachyon]|nr:uncharacterized protein LOC104583378 isoform X2 [Brachypodium distachyon]KQK11485.1 hypothetical protein BRADI_2g60503v3 [Brachypodium distachyon]|eukprot:XP_014754328.1 uncharacterized protein LOC104583378 isoform X2 [Brachypodium distachyon]
MALRPGGRYHFFTIWPIAFEERGLEAMLSFLYEDCNVPKNSFTLRFMMHISESTNIIGTTINCLRLVTPHFKSTADVVIKEIMQLPTQDFSCFPLEVVNVNAEHYWTEMNTTFAGWFCPDPLCCQGYENNVLSCCRGGKSSSGNKLRLSSIFPEPVSQVFLQCYISPFEYGNLHGSAARYDSSSLENYPLLKLDILLMPHDSLEEPKSTGDGFVIEAINGEMQHLTHLNVHPNQLDEMLLPKATDYLYHNTAATTYEISWRSNHGSAHLCVDKTSARIISGAPTASTGQGRNKNSKVLLEMLQEIMKNTLARECLKLWVIRSSEKLQSMFTAWLKQ